MTEKRFTKCCPKIRDYDEEMSCTEVCDLLNKFHEENQQYQEWLDALKEELSLADRDNTVLEKENKELKVTNGEMEDYLARMEEENKELRSDKDYWKTLAQSLAKTNGTLKLKDEHIGWKRVDV